MTPKKMPAAAIVAFIGENGCFCARMRQSPLWSAGTLNAPDSPVFPTVQWPWPARFAQQAFPSPLCFAQHVLPSPACLVQHPSFVVQSGPQQSHAPSLSASLQQTAEPSSAFWQQAARPPSSRTHTTSVLSQQPFLTSA
jgi:hypothetical protein